MTSEVDRFWRHVDKSGECWEWTSTVRTGYGMFSVKRAGRWIPVSAHRYSYELATGTTLSSQDFICHKCDNPPCVRPDHLFIGSHQDNMDDMYSKGRRPRAVPYQKKEFRKASKLSYQDYLDIVEELKTPYWGQNKMLAEKYGVARSTISHIKTGRFVPAAISVHENF